MKNVFVLLIFIIVITGCYNNNEKLKDSEINNPNKEPTIEDIVDKKMNEMTIEEKIAQMLIVYYYKDEVDSTLKDVFTSNTPGGFILMQENITSYEKTKNFVNELKKLSDIPLIISIDQEGGNVQKLKKLRIKR